MTELVNAGTRVQVATRVCPPRPGDKIAVHCDHDDKRAVFLDTEAGPSAKSFVFDHVFTDGQEEVYEKLGVPMLKEVFEGFNVCLFAYGQTGSGKTHSLFGDLDDTEANGIAPRFARAMMEEAQVRVEADIGATIKFSMSMVEIYMEKVRDLLVPRVRGQEPESLDIHEDSQHRVFVKGASVHSVLTLERMLELLKMGNLNRQTGETKMNETSSRSHAIIQITISQKYDSLEMRDVECVASLVDLAGSERQSRTESTGVAFEEAKKINLSLLMLGRALNAFSERKGGDAYISLRASKLTRLLSESLGGNSKTWMLATVSPASVNLTETISTLEYAQNAMAITNKAKINDTKKNLEMKRLKELVVSFQNRLDLLGIRKEELQETNESLLCERDALRRTLKNVSGDQQTREKLESVLKNIQVINTTLQKRIEATSHVGVSSLDNNSSFLCFKGRCTISLKSVLRGHRRSFIIGLLTESGLLTDAKLRVHMFPTKPIISCVNDPMYLVGESLQFYVHIVSATGIPKAFSSNVFCKFSLLYDRENRYFTTSTIKNSTDPQWNLVKVFEIQNITSELIQSLDSCSFLTFEVFGFSV